MAVGATVATRETWRGTHLGEFVGLPPTGRAVVLTRMHFFRIERGRIVAEWSAGSILDHLVAGAW